MIPMPRASLLKRMPSGPRTSRLNGPIAQDGFFNTEQIDYLTPVKNSELKKSATNLAQNQEDENVDSLVYTVSRRRSSLRQIRSDDPTKDINLFE